MQYIIREKMTSETLKLHVSKNFNISKTKQDIKKLKTPLRLVWKCCSVAFKIRSTIFWLQGHFKARKQKHTPPHPLQMNDSASALIILVPVAQAKAYTMCWCRFLLYATFHQKRLIRKKRSFVTLNYAI